MSYFQVKIFLMKTFITNVLFLIGCLSSGLAQNCLSEGIVFSSQAQLDAFPDLYPGCETILGDVDIEEAVTGDIKNLLGLSQLTTIGGYLDIFDNDALVSLEGLNNIVFIGDRLSIAANDALSHVDGLESLSGVGSSIRISDNAALKRITALTGIKKVHKDLSIIRNGLLSNLIGLDSIKEISGHLNIVSNESLTNLSGLAAVSAVGNIFHVFENENLRSLDALSKLTSVGSDLIIDGNARLASLQGLEQLNSVGGFLQIVNNASINNLNGLNNLRAIGGLLQVYNNFALTSLSGIDSIAHSSITNLALLSSNKLTDCSVKSICDYLKILPNLVAISNNGLGCNSSAQILDSCTKGESVNSNPGQSRDIILYPNPTKGEVKIKANKIENAQVQVYDYTGRLVLSAVTQAQTINLAKLPAGFYLVKVVDNKRIYNKTIIKSE